MQDYADDVMEAVRLLDRERGVVLMGWSMGGLVAMMAAGGCEARAVVGLAPSAPATERNPDKVIQHGEFGPEEYGITSDDPREQRAMPDLEIDERVIALASLGRESRYARGERAAGIVIDSLPCPLLIATGSADALWPRSRYDGLHLPADHISATGASHWGLVLNRRTVSVLAREVSMWLSPAA